MRMIDSFQFDGGDPINLELDPEAQAQPGLPRRPAPISTHPGAPQQAPVPPTQFSPSSFPLQLPAQAGYRRCGAHDLPTDARGDCPQCLHVRAVAAREAARRRLIGWAAALAFAALLSLGLFAMWRHEATAQQRAAAALTARYETPVVVFTTQSCGACKITRAYLEKNNVPFTERSLDGDPLAVQEFDALVERPLVPVVVIGDEVQEGFNPLEFERAMARHKVQRRPAAPL